MSRIVIRNTSGCLALKKNYKHTPTICNPYYFSTSTTVARTRLNVTLYVHCLSVCLFIFLDPAEFPTKDKVAIHVEAKRRSKLPQGYFRNPSGLEGFCPLGIQPPLPSNGRPLYQRQTDTLSFPHVFAWIFYFDTCEGTGLAVQPIGV
jgi:hypothetical protein